MSAAEKTERANLGTPPRRGVKTKILGVCLLFLGLMDSMLSWRGGFEVAQLYIVFVVLGLLLIVIGTIRQRRSPDNRESARP